MLHVLHANKIIFIVIVIVTVIVIIIVLVIVMMTSSNEKLFRRYWSLVRGIHRSPVNSPHKGQ